MRERAERAGDGGGGDGGGLGGGTGGGDGCCEATPSAQSTTRGIFAARIAVKVVAAVCAVGEEPRGLHARSPVGPKLTQPLDNLKY